eukprot:317884_1
MKDESKEKFAKNAKRCFDAGAAQGGRLVGKVKKLKKDFYGEDSDEEEEEESEESESEEKEDDSESEEEKEKEKTPREILGEVKELIGTIIDIKDVLIGQCEKKEAENTVQSAEKIDKSSDDEKSDDKTSCNPVNLTNSHLLIGDPSDQSSEEEKSDDETASEPSNLPKVEKSLEKCSLDQSSGEEKSDHDTESDPSILAEVGKPLEQCSLDDSSEKEKNDSQMQSGASNPAIVDMSLDEGSSDSDDDSECFENADGTNKTTGMRSCMMPFTQIGNVKTELCEAQE